MRSWSGFLQQSDSAAGEMIVGSKKVLLADEISTGLDSSTTYQIVRCMRNVVKMRRSTVLMSLLQPAPETFQLFDDVMLLAEGGVPPPPLSMGPPLCAITSKLFSHLFKLLILSAWQSLIPPPLIPPSSP